ncbi:hypothetical protein, partial [Bacillus velezensis]|uniref:hypothetical protein n=1 Tax=Bacillus velezensis TaxID=492670 RepID=UPI003CF4A929
AAIGNVSVEVKRLANSQTLVSGTSYANSTTPIGQGSLTITLGAWVTDGAEDPNAPYNPASPPTYTSFTDKPGATPVTINIG